MPSSRDKGNRVAIVGASSLRGKEVKLVLEDRNFPAGDIVLLDEPSAVGTLTEAGGEPAFIRALTEASFEDARFVFFTGSQRDTEENWRRAQSSGATVIDLTGVLAASPAATVSIPALATVFLPRPGLALNPSSAQPPTNSKFPVPFSSPGSGVIIGCTVAAALAKFSPLRTVAMLFPPVSERDQIAVDELESQTTNLLSFRPITQTIFDAQVAFNLLAGYGEESKPTFHDVRSSIARDVAHYAGERAHAPAIQLVQAPVFYGYAFATYVEFTKPPTPEQLELSFAAVGVKVAAAGEPPPTNISVAGENEIHLARIEPDPNVPTGFWIWGVADNLRLSAVNAVRIAEELVAEPPIQ
ncbi:MAG TPA: Asd/ArgC dimerization domain-containing protein [Candidatus Acidoferrales bacterium]